MNKLTNKAFFVLFFRRELRPLLGKNYFNLVVLVIILFTTFTVIGFAKGSLLYLEYKMKDPFINWINIIPSGKSELDIDIMLRELNSESIAGHYNINNVVGYNRFFLNFYYYDDILNYYASGDLDTTRIAGFAARTLDTSDPVVNEMFLPWNLETGSPFYDDMDFGLILTPGMLRRMNYPLETPYVWIDFAALDPDDHTKQLRFAIPVPVRAVVNTIPGLARFASTPYFFQQRFEPRGQNPLNPFRDNRMVIGFSGTWHEVEQLTKQLRNYLLQNAPSETHKLRDIWFEPADRKPDPELFNLFITFTPREINHEQLNRLFLELYNAPILADFQQQMYRMYDYAGKLGGLRRHTNFDRISVNFITPDKISEFNSMLYDRYRLEVDMAQIESRKNYNFVTSLTGIISSALIIFSILSVLFFVSHLLKKHLDSIIRNLGTFKAFGLQDHLLTRVYTGVVIFILAIATVLALIVSAAFGYLGSIRFILSVFVYEIEPGIYFELFSIYLLIAIAMLFFCSIVFINMITRNILHHTPGDLIYERK